MASVAVECPFCGDQFFSIDFDKIGVDECCCCDNLRVYCKVVKNSRYPFYVAVEYSREYPLIT